VLRAELIPPRSWRKLNLKTWRGIDITQKQYNHLHGSMTCSPTYYEILDLPTAIQHDQTIPSQILRSAYRRALLQNHPDKSTKKPPLNSNQKPAIYSIDQISAAFKILSDPKLRGKYDAESKLQPNTATNVNGEIERRGFQTGIEVVDLDDLQMDEEKGTWYRACRCGDDWGFFIREEDLEEAADEGEVSVGCRGCSLWLKVLFGVVEEVAQEDSGSGELRDEREMAIS